MVATNINDGQGDRSTEILRLLRENQRVAVPDKIRDIKDETGKVNILEQLASQMSDAAHLRLSLITLTALIPTRALGRTQDLNDSRDLDLAVARDRAVARALQRAHELAQTEGEALRRALDVARALVLDPTLDGVKARTRVLVRDRDRDLSLVRAFDAALAQREALLPLYTANLEALYHIVEYVAVGSSQALKRVSESYHKLRASALNEALRLQASADAAGKSDIPLHTSIADLIVSMLWEMVGDDVRYVQLDGVPVLTADKLAQDVAPYFQALQTFSNTYRRLTGEPQSDLHITQIQHDNAQVAFTADVGAALRAFIETTTFHKGQTQTDLRQLHLAAEQKQGDIDAATAELKMAQAMAAKVSIDHSESSRVNKLVAEAQAKLSVAQTERTALTEQIHRLERDLLQIYLHMAEQFVSKYGPTLAPTERIRTILETAQVLTQMGTSLLTLRIG